MALILGSPKWEGRTSGGGRRGTGFDAIKNFLPQLPPERVLERGGFLVTGSVHTLGERSKDFSTKVEARAREWTRSVIPKVSFRCYIDQHSIRLLMGEKKVTP